MYKTDMADQIPVAVEPLHVDQILRDLNPWWSPPHEVRPKPPAFRRRQVQALLERLQKPRALMQVVRGPRQVGKTTAILQLVEELLAGGIRPADILLIRFDLEPLREAGLATLVRWFEDAIRKRKLDDGAPAFLFLDEVHKLPAWNEELKHLSEISRPRVLLTGSSSVLVAKGARESLAGRVVTTQFPPFGFREVLEAWDPELVPPGPPIRLLDAFSPRAREHFRAIHAFTTRHVRELAPALDRYYNRGGYPRLHSGEVDDDSWCDYVVETVFERVLGVDIPDLFPVEQPRLLRHLYLSVARRTGQEVSQIDLAEEAIVAGIKTNQPTVGRYLHYLSDALLTRELRRYPLGKSRNARLPVKMVLSDLGVRNAIFRGAPSLRDSAPDIVGPLVETVVQTVLHDTDLALHFYRDRIDPDARKSAFEEVDFVAERTDGTVLPVEVKFREKIDGDDVATIKRFIARYRAPAGFVVTRDTWFEDGPVLALPLADFLLGF
jgi:predicted AAA+ superfamily ATPase